MMQSFLANIMRKTLEVVTEITDEADEAVLALGGTNEERRHRFMGYYRNLTIEAPNFASFVTALGAACTADERRRLLVNLWAALEREKAEGRCALMSSLLRMQACHEAALVEFVGGHPKTIRRCLEYLELLF